MGFGGWKRYAEGYFLAGWTSNAADPDFALNNNDLDSGGQPVIRQVVQAVIVVQKSKSSTFLNLYQKIKF
ncbi:baseplate wedge subunit and tail pin [Klebsiella phage CPRSB]|nr:baseplate wedge subunit and tail pin [Klebsiella phage CPRSB]